MASHAPVISIIVWKEDALLPAMFNLLHGSSRAYHKIDTSWWAKMNWTQIRALVSSWRMHCMYNSKAKGTSQAEATSNIKKIKPIALAIFKLCESEGLSQLGSWLENSVKYFLNLRSNFLKVFRVNLKVFMSLTNTAPSSSRKIVIDFLVNLLHGLPPNLHCLYYELLLWFMINKMHIAPIPVLCLIFTYTKGERNIKNREI